MHHDYFMRQIQILTNIVAHHLGKEQIVHEITDPYLFAQSNELYKILMGLLADGKINEAENLLFDVIEQGGIDKEDAFNLAFDFYLKVNAYHDDYLKLCNFSRAEADAGWADITRLLEI